MEQNLPEWQVGEDKPETSNLELPQWESDCDCPCEICQKIRLAKQNGTYDPEWDYANDQPLSKTFQMFNS